MFLIEFKVFISIFFFSYTLLHRSLMSLNHTYNAYTHMEGGNKECKGSHSCCKGSKSKRCVHVLEMSPSGLVAGVNVCV